MSTSTKASCPLCERDLDCEETVVIREKGAEGINRASIERGVGVRVKAGTSVHKTCRVNHTNKKDLVNASKKDVSAQSVKRSARVSLGPYDSKMHCFFCGTDAKRNSEERICYVKTDAFVQTILVHCKTRGDEWAVAVQGRNEHFGGDLHAADCVYHQSCNVNFRTMRDIPRPFTSVESAKRRKSGRPKDHDQDEAFEKVCVFLEENDEEQLTISDLVAKMGEYLCDSKSTAYGNQYLKEKLMSRYGNSIFVTEGRSGVRNIVTFRGKTCYILREYHNSPREDDEEAQ